MIDLGVDVPAARIIECYKENPDVKIIALSALLTTTMPALKETVEALNAADFRGNIKVMVGGAPITEAFAEEIGQMVIQMMRPVRLHWLKSWRPDLIGLCRY